MMSASGAPRLDGRVAIVTGGATGIGLATVRAFWREGAAVGVIGRGRRPLEALESEADGRGAALLAAVGDVSRAEDVERFVGAVLARFGRLDTLVNNAGVNPHRGRSVLDTTEGDWDLAMAVNVRGPFLCTKAVLPHMRRQRRGWIVNIASIGGRLSPDGQNCGYRASKFGLRGFSWTLAKDVRDDDIAVSVVFPGTTRTEMVAAEAEEASPWLSPDDVAEVVLFLATRDPKVVIPEITVSPRCRIGGPQCPYT